MSLLCLAGALALAAAVLAVPERPAFSVHLPDVRLEYPGSEYRAEIEGPDGKRTWAFAIYEGGDAWRVPIWTPRKGVYRLLRIVREQGESQESVTIAVGSQRRLEVARVPRSRPPAAPLEKPLVEAGAFETFYTAPAPWCVNDHTLVQGPDGTWHLFGITHPLPFDFNKDPGLNLAHATASSLLQRPWLTQSPAVTADRERYREYLLWAPHVIRHRGLYYMFVCAGDKTTHRYAIHLLTSPDLQSWTRHPANPLLVDGFDGRDPMVLRVGNRWVLYYTATSTPEGGNHLVACVTSADLVHWSDRRVVFLHPRAGTFGGPTESPFVVRRGRRYYLFVCDNDWTDVYVSRDPFHWEPEQRTTRIQSHASEIVRDVDGRWYITHAGWMNGPVRIAPLTWHDGE